MSGCALVPKKPAEGAFFSFVAQFCSLFIHMGQLKNIFFFTFLIGVIWKKLRLVSVFPDFALINGNFKT